MADHVEEREFTLRLVFRTAFAEGTLVDGLPPLPHLAVIGVGHWTNHIRHLYVTRARYVLLVVILLRAGLEQHQIVILQVLREPARVDEQGRGSLRKCEAREKCKSEGKRLNFHTCSPVSRRQPGTTSAFT